MRRRQLLLDRPRRQRRRRRQVGPLLQGGLHHHRRREELTSIAFGMLAPLIHHAYFLVVSIGHYPQARRSGAPAAQTPLCGTATAAPTSTHPQWPPTCQSAVRSYWCISKQLRVRQKIAHVRIADCGAPFLVHIRTDATSDMDTAGIANNQASRGTYAQLVQLRFKVK